MTDSIFVSGFPASIVFDRKNRELVVTERINGNLYFIDAEAFVIKSVVRAGRDFSHGIFLNENKNGATID